MHEDGDLPVLQRERIWDAQGGPALEVWGPHARPQQARLSRDKLEQKTEGSFQNAVLSLDTRTPVCRWREGIKFPFNSMGVYLLKNE